VSLKESWHCPYPHLQSSALEEGGHKTNSTHGLPQETVTMPREIETSGNCRRVEIVVEGNWRAICRFNDDTAYPEIHLFVRK
jgi:hypothetical protein